MSHPLEDDATPDSSEAPEYLTGDEVDPADPGLQPGRGTGAREVLRGHSAAITCCRFSPGGANLVSASGDGVVRVWAPHSTAGNAARAAVLQCAAPISALAWDARADKVANPPHCLLETPHVLLTARVNVPLSPFEQSSRPSNQAVIQSRYAQLARCFP